MGQSRIYTVEEQTAWLNRNSAGGPQSMDEYQCEKIGKTLCEPDALRAVCRSSFIAPSIMEAIHGIEQRRPQRKPCKTTVCVLAGIVTVVWLGAMGYFTISAYKDKDREAALPQKVQLLAQN